MKRAAFTLIELIIVIVLLGILAATALPRYVDFSTEAKYAKWNTIISNFSSGLKTASLKHRATGKPVNTLSNSTSTFNIGFSDDKYPFGASSSEVVESTINSSTYTLGEAGSQAANNALCATLFENIVQGVPVHASTASSVGASNTDCKHTGGPASGKELCTYYDTNHKSCTYLIVNGVDNSTDNLATYAAFEYCGSIASNNCSSDFRLGKVCIFRKVDNVVQQNNSSSLCEGRFE